MTKCVINISLNIFSVVNENLSCIFLNVNSQAKRYHDFVALLIFRSTPSISCVQHIFWNRILLSMCACNKGYCASWHCKLLAVRLTFVYGPIGRTEVGSFLVEVRRRTDVAVRNIPFGYLRRHIEFWEYPQSFCWHPNDVKWTLKSRILGQTTSNGRPC